MDRIRLIRHTDKKYSQLAQEHWDSVAKPLRSFGVLETFWNRIAAVQKTEFPDISERAVVVMCADNGVVAEGVTQTDSSVTAVCTEAIACGRSNINALADTFRADVYAVDIGVAADLECDRVISRKIAYGSDNIAVGPAMTVENVYRAVAVGMDMVYKQLMKTLEDNKVTPIEAVGKEFDPQFHNAVQHVEKDDVGENIVVEEFEKGYMYGDTVLRHSMVIVAN